MRSFSDFLLAKEGNMRGLFQNPGAPGPGDQQTGTGTKRQPQPKNPYLRNAATIGGGGSMPAMPTTMQPPR